MNNNSDVFKQLNISIRKLKIDSIIDDEKAFIYRESNLSEKFNKVINLFSKKYDGMLCGSTLLKAYGLITRKPEDIDMIITKMQLEAIKADYKIYLPEYLDELDIESIGFIKVEGVTVDLFIDDVKYQSERRVNGILVDNFLHVIKKKLEFHEHRYTKYSDRQKDIKDFTDIINLVNSSNIEPENI